MQNALHHIAIFVSSMERALHLFKDFLGFELVWGVSQIGGQKLAAMVGVSSIEAEMAYLRGRPSGVALELIRMIRPPMKKDEVVFGAPGTAILSLVVKDLDGLNSRLKEEGWAPLTSPMEIYSPERDPIRAFCFRTEEGLTVELIEVG